MAFSKDKWKEKHCIISKCPYNCISKTPVNCPIGKIALKKLEREVG